MGFFIFKDKNIIKNAIIVSYDNHHIYLWTTKKVANLDKISCSLENYFAYKIPHDLDIKEVDRMGWRAGIWPFELNKFLPKKLQKSDFEIPKPCGSLFGDFIVNQKKLKGEKNNPYINPEGYLATIVHEFGHIYYGQHKLWWYSDKKTNISFLKAAKKLYEAGDDLFDFPGLHNTLKSEESKLIADVPNPKIVIAGSGMSSGGRIVHHERHYLPDPNNTILLTGYQSLGTMGRLIQEGVKKVHISGEDINVRAHIVTILGYSGHKDGNGLLGFVEDMQDTIKKVFVVMGEPKSEMFLAQRLRDNLGIEAHVPEEGSTVSLIC